MATTAGTGVIINELYLKAGSAGAAYAQKFVELYNPTDTAVSLSGWSLQYRAATSVAPASGVGTLSGSIPARGYYLVSMPGNGSVGAELPTADAAVTINPSGTTGQVFLADTTDKLNPPVGNVSGTEHVVDFVGYGGATSFEGAVAPVTDPNSTPNSLARTEFIDSDNNQADLTHPATITPQSSGQPDPGTPDPGTPGPGTPVAITAIQGTGAASPLAGQTVTTRGVVTASYPTGGYNGYYIQTPGTGGTIDATHTASDALFVFSNSTVGSVAVGDYVEVTGEVSEYYDLTQITVTGGSGLTTLSESVTAPTPAAVSLPRASAERETLEGMLLAPRGEFTVSSTYTTNQYGEIGLAAGSTPLLTPTEVARPTTSAYTAAVAENAARGVVLDDGATTNFLSAANQGIALPYLTPDTPLSVGADVTFTGAVIFDYRNSTWKFQPTTQLTAGNAASVQPASFSNVRTDAPRAVGGDIQIASFNVLNYFTTTGDTVSGCSFYTDREKNPITVNTGCDARGAADAANLARQQAKIVAAINGLNAEVVSLEEIENSAVFGRNRDSALGTLTAALNTAAGSNVWEFVASPTALPANEDVIRTAFIYKKDAVQPVGSSRILADGTAFNNARRPLAQEFAAAGKPDGATFIAIVNHFKSKGSGSGADADTGDGQGASNASRVAQANALADFSQTLQDEWDTDRVFLIGDFNAYSQEDPIIALTDRGYVDLGATSGKYSYSFSGASGSLDHILASPAAYTAVTGVDIWNINSGESIALEYSRYNYNLTNFYNESPYRSSDHDPIVVGVQFEAADVKLNLLNINDFHGRIDANTVKFAGTIEQLRAENGENNSVLLSDGDNIGASLFASSSQRDQPTIDVLNALDLAASAVGNHEFDAGFTDLTDRVVGSGATKNAQFPYLGANVYQTGTETPALPEYELIDRGGLTVGVIGAVTEETPTLVSPGGIATLSFGDPVDAVNRVAAQLSDGNMANGEADVLVAEYHEGAGAGTPEGSTLAEELDAGGMFNRVVTATSPLVDVIYTGHTHKQYAWDAAIPGTSNTRPVLQTGSYGENIGQVVLSVNPENNTVSGYTARNVPRTTVADANLIAAYPRAAEVKTIVDAAVAAADVTGRVPVGSITGDITTAYSGGSYTGGSYTGGTRDNRAAESTLGNLVANSLVSSLSATDRGGADIGVVNPGGLRAELFYAPDGTVSYAEANAVLPFVNNLWTTSLTGAQFKAVLEQQWQLNADGTVPSRPFLKLGLSENVSYTYDDGRAQGDRVTGVWIDGKPLVAADTYRIGSFSFLLQGGDNFREFLKGTDTRDSGLIDRDAWIEYLTANSPIVPSYTARAAKVTGAPTSAVAAGDTVEFEVSGLNLTSLGAPETTELAASWTGSTATFAAIPVVDGTGQVRVTVPVDAVAASEFVLTGKESGTTVRIPLTVTVAPVDPGTDPGSEKPTEEPSPATDGQLTESLRDLVSVAPDTARPGDTVTVFTGTEHADEWISVWLHSTPVSLGGWTQVTATGSTRVEIPPTAELGSHRIVVLDATGAVLGWTTVTVVSASGGSGGDAAGSGTLSVTGGVDVSLALWSALALLASGGFFAARRRRATD
ncbi:ExeM/NucH family extracellular endonuclease [Klugiella xanthotipulae]